jgi:hypothetical protein
MLTSADGPATRAKAGLWGIVVLVGAWACMALSSLSVLESRSLIGMHISDLLPSAAPPYLLW